MGGRVRGFRNKLAVLLVIVMLIQLSGLSILLAATEEAPADDTTSGVTELQSEDTGGGEANAADAMAETVEATASGLAAGTVNLRISSTQPQISGILPGSDESGETVAFSVYQQGSIGVLTINDEATGAFTYVLSPGAEGADTVAYKVYNTSGDEALGNVNIIVYPRIVYRFQALGFPGREAQQSGWGLWGTDTFTSPTPAVEWEAASVKIGSTAPGHARSFSFTVPSDGYYRISFKADLCPPAASPPIANVVVSIDDVEAGKYISADPTKTTRVRGPERLLNVMPRSLTAGTHKLTLKSADTSGRMWVEAFTLEKVVGVAADSIEFETSRGISDTGFLTGFAENGEPLTFSVVKQGSRGVLTVDDPATGKFTYRPNSGETGMDVVRYKVKNLSGDEAEGIVNVEIYTSAIYKFNRLGFAGAGSPPKLEGWNLEGSFAEAPAVSLESNGDVLIGTTAAGQSRTFTFNMPEEGFYKVKFKAPLKTPSNNPPAANIVVIVDGQEIGKYTSINPTAGEGPVRELGNRPWKITAGTHTLTLKSADTNGRMWVSELILEKTPSPSAGTINLQLAAGETVSGTLIGADVDNEELTFSVVQQGTKGTLTITDQHAGTFSYTPNAGQTGDDVIKYKVVNNSGREAEGFVYIHVYAKLDPDHPVYNFFNLPGLQTEFGQDYGARPQDGLKVIGSLLDAPRISWEGSAVKIGSSIGNSRSFEIFIPQTGIYLMKFTGLKQSWGANIVLSIDGKYMGKYMGYSAASIPDSTQEIVYTQLTEGWHVLNLLASDLSPGAVNGRMYINSLSLDKLSTAPVVDSLSLVTDQPVITEGMNVQISLLAEVNNPDGSKTPVDLRNMDDVEISYSVDNTAVATIDSATGRLRALHEGTATVTVDVEAGSETRSAQLEVSVIKIETAKTRSTVYTTEKVTNARGNVQQYDWAAGMKDLAVSKADFYIAQGMDFLWELIPPQSLPRCIFVNNELGSPTSGREIYKYGNYPWIVDPINHPWKVKDPVTGELFPSNDFEAYYNSGLDEHGIFNSSLADRSLLVNTLYPEKGPTWGVDDGMGWVDESGNRYTFIAYYTCMGIWWGHLMPILDSFRDAYLYTGDAKYANAGIILLDRIADIYPSLSTGAYSRIYATNHPGTNAGKAVGSIWDTILVKDFLYAYDAFFPALADDSDTVEDAIGYLSQKADEYSLVLNKATPAAIRKNIEDGIVKEVYPAVKDAEIYGNNGMHQSALALAAVVYDKNPETSQWLDFDFQSGELYTDPYRVTGGNVGVVFTNLVDRDGQGNESSLFYNSTWLGSFQEMASVLDGYTGYEGPNNVDLYTHVKFKKMFSAFLPMIMLERFTPSIGDTGGAGSPGLIPEQKQMLDAYRHYNEPVFAQMVYLLNNNKTEGLHGGIFEENPNQLAEEIEEVIREYGTFNLKSSNMTGYGFAALRDGTGGAASYGITKFFKDLRIVEQTAVMTEIANGLEFAAAAPGDYITFEFEVPAGKAYEIDVKANYKAAYGRYEVQVDGQTINEELDFFVGPFEHKPVGNIHLTEGTHRLTFLCIGRNDKGSGYKMCLNELALLDASEQEKRDAGQNANTMRDAWIHYGLTAAFHAHSGILNLGLHAFGLDLAPDLGYPETNSATDAHHFQWMSNTISHNTVLVDQTRQSPVYAGQPRHFDDSGMVKLFDAEAPGVYPQTELYKRTTAMIRVDGINSYIVDFFRVKGGNEHHFSFHSAEGTVTAEGLELIQQPTGTYAGADVPYGAPAVGDYRQYTGPGFHFLKNVQRDNTPRTRFSVDWDITDTWKVLGSPRDVHLKLTMLAPVDSVALADGTPSTYNAANPEALRYLIAQRSGTNLSTNFTSVLEPYAGEQFITNTSQADVCLADGTPVDELTAKAVKVELSNGRTDYIVSSIDPEETYVIDGKFMFKGAFGVYSEYEGEQLYGYVNDGTLIGLEEAPLVDGSTARITGTVKDFTREMQLQNSLTVEMDLNGMKLQELVGQTIYIDNDGVRNAAYEIKEAAQLENGQVELGIGDITLIRGYANVNDFSSGYIYDVAVGKAFYIPLSSEGQGDQYGSADLEALSLDKGTLSPAFDSAVTEYTVSVPNSVASVSVTSVVRDPNASLTVNGKAVAGGAASEPVSLAAGSVTWIEVVVTSVNGDQKTYRIGVTRGGNTTDPGTGGPPAATPEPGEPRQELATKTKSTSADGKTTLALELNEQSILNALEGDHPETVITLLVAEESDRVVVGLNGQLASMMESRQAILDIQTPIGSFKLPADQLVTGRWAEYFGPQTELSSLSVAVEISRTPEEQVKVIENQAEKSGYTLVVPPVDFKIVVSDGRLTREINTFNTFVEREIPLPAGIDPAEVSTAVMLSSDGTAHHVPTAIIERDGRYYARISSLTNSTYSVIKNPESFTDMEKHWAKELVTDMASRRILFGTGDNKFQPDLAITRADFITLAIRTLGLKEDGETDAFRDVKKDARYYGAVAKAYEYGLTEGDGQGNFNPQKQITREEAVTILGRMLEIAGKAAPESESEREAPLDRFTDKDLISHWAAAGVAGAAQLGIVEGDAGKFRPKDSITRAETAKILWKLLSVCGLIQ